MGCANQKEAVLPSPGGRAPPLLFAGANRRRGRPHGAQGGVAASTTTRKYPMFLLPVPDFLALKTLAPHQALHDKLVRFEDSKHRGRVIFVSHQWAGYGHPDPANYQLSCLQRVLQRYGNPEQRSAQHPALGRPRSRGAALGLARGSLYLPPALPRLFRRPAAA